MYVPESGDCNFEEIQEFFNEIAYRRHWDVRKVKGGERLRMLDQKDEEGVTRDRVIVGKSAGIGSYIFDQQICDVV